MPSFCNHCGKEIPADDKFCMTCGTNIETGQAPYSGAGKRHTGLFTMLAITVFILAAGIIMISIFAGSSSVTAGKTPEDTFAALQTALRNNNFEGVYELVPPSQRSKGEFTRLREELQHSFDNPGNMPPAMYEILKKRVDSYGGNVAKMSDKQLGAVFIEFVVLGSDRGKHQVEDIKVAEIDSIEPRKNNENIVELNLTQGRDIDLVLENGLWYIQGID